MRQEYMNIFKQKYLKYMINSDPFKARKINERRSFLSLLLLFLSITFFWLRYCHKISKIGRDICKLKINE